MTDYNADRTGTSTSPDEEAYPPSRLQLARFFLEDFHIKPDDPNYRKVAAAIEGGLSWSEVSDMPELENWDGARDYFEDYRCFEVNLFDHDCDKGRRTQIAQYLGDTGLIGSEADYLRVADILGQGYSWEVVLDMAELERWPEAHQMLEEFADSGFDQISSPRTLMPKAAKARKSL